MNLLTIKEISRELGIPESTLRYWRDKYEEFIPAVGKGRKKRYREEALMVFKRISELISDNLSANEIAERLSIEFARNIEVAETGSAKKAAILDIYAIQKTLQQIAATQQELARLVSENRELKAEIEKLSTRMEEQERKNEERDKRLMEVLRRIQEKQEKQKKPWWKKIFNI